MRRRHGSVLLLLAAFITGGCLQKDAVHTVYVSPDGSIRWTINESNVFSDDADPSKRQLEENAFISSAVSGTHTAAQAFRAMGADGIIRTSIPREDRPFHVITDAQFSSLDGALSRFFKEAGLQASVVMKHEDGRTSVRMKLDFSKEPVDRGSPVLKMVEDLDDLRFVLTEGKFIAGGGFDVPDRMHARLSRSWLAAAETAMEKKREIELVLTWDPNGAQLPEK